MKHAKINLILAGPASAERESLGKAISAKICKAPEEVFAARHNYEGAEDLAIILLAADADMEEWAKVNNTADLVLSPSASEEDKMEAIYGCRTSLLNSRHTWLLTDIDCEQYIRSVNRNTFACVQICQLPDDCGYGVAVDTVNLADYSEDDIREEISFFGETIYDVEQRLPDHDTRRLLAEYIFENHALEHMVAAFSTYEEAKAFLHSYRDKMYVGEDQVPEMKNHSTEEWVSYSDDIELWLRTTDPVLPTDFEVVRAAPSLLHANEWAFTHRFIYLGDYDLNNAADVRILNRDGEMDDLVLEGESPDSIMHCMDGTPDRVHDPDYVLDYALLAALLSNNEMGAQYMREEQAMKLLHNIVNNNQ